MPENQFYVGLDLGKMHDPTALVVLDRTLPPPDAAGRAAATYDCCHLQRWPLGTPYTTIEDDVCELVEARPLAGRCTLCIDWTGVGMALVDAFRRRQLTCRLRPVLITAGHAATRVKDGYHVAKTALGSTLKTVMGGGRLFFAKEYPEAAVVKRELQTFQTKITQAGNVTLEAWRTRDHDDLVLAVAIPLWVAERGRQGGIVSIRSPRGPSGRGWQKIPPLFHF